MKAAKLLLSKSAKKDDLMELLENEELYSKKVKKTLLKVTNFLSLKKQMTNALDPDVVADVKKVITATAKSAPKPKMKKDSPIVTEIKAATKVKQLKKIAKANEQFNWKKLKKLDFDEMQKAMLSGAKSVVKIKMIANPMIAEIEGFGKVKKLRKWVKANDDFDFKGIKAMKEMDLFELQQKLIAAIPAEIEAKSGGKRGAVVNHIDQEARRAR
ncbi:unnamed protein product, partial [marine sediment metagenome]